MPEYVTPGVYFEWTDESATRVLPSRTDIAAFVGVAERGPVDTSVRILTWTQFQTVFGGFIPNGYLACAVNGFFENGGRECRVIRVVAKFATAVVKKFQNARQAIVISSDGFVAGAVMTATQTRTTSRVGAQPIDRRSSIVTDSSGFPQGALVKIEQGSLLASRHVKDSSLSPARIYWDSPLDAAFNINNPIQFTTTHQVDVLIRSVEPNLIEWEPSLPDYFNLAPDIELATGVGPAGDPATVADAATAPGLGTATGVLLGEDNKPTLHIAARNAGSWGNDLVVSVSRGNSAATRSARAPQPADRKSTVVDSVANFPVGAIVRIFQQAAPTPLESYRAITAVDARFNRLVWSQPLDATYDLMAAQTGLRPLSLETVEFNLSIYLGGSLKEAFVGLSLFPSPKPQTEVKPEDIENDKRSARKMHAQTVVNYTSKLICISDKRWQKDRIDLFESLPNPKAQNLRCGRLRLAGGRDGIAGLRPRDFTGDPGSTKLTGLRVLEKDDAPAIIAMPDVVMQAAPARRKQVPPPPPPRDPCLPPFSGPPPEVEPAPGWVERAHEFSFEEIERIETTMIEHCERHRFRMALLDPPLFSHAGESIDIEGIQGWRKRFDSSYAALNFPWLLVNDPLRLNGQVVRPIPPSGHAAGIYAQTDFNSGVWTAPANVETQWAQGLAQSINAEAQGALNPAGINCFRIFPGRGLRLYGARTVSSNGAWRFVNVRRLMMMIEKSLDVSLQWSAFEPANLDLRDSLVAAIGGFLETMWQRGAFLGVVAEEAFFVKCDETNNPQDEVDNGRLHIDIGVAPVRPAEFVVVRIGKTADSIELTEAGAPEAAEAIA